MPRRETTRVSTSIRRPRTPPSPAHRPPLAASPGLTAPACRPRRGTKAVGFAADEDTMPESTSARVTVHETLPSRVLIGRGARHELPGEIERLGARRVLLVATGSAQAASR